MSHVFFTLTDVTGRPLQYQNVKFSLIAPGNPFTHVASAVIQTRSVSTDIDGKFDIDLLPNSQYEQAGTRYKVEAKDGLTNPDTTWYIVVPDGAGPFDMRDLLTTPPTPGTPIPPVQAHALGDHTDVNTTGETAGDVLGFDGTLWVPVPAGSGGGSGYTHFQDIAAQVTTVTHNLGYRPGGIKLFSPDWTTEYDEFAVQHISVNQLTIGTDQSFRGYVTVS